MMRKIMIVDDEKDTIEAVETVLKQARYSVVTASSGKECLDKLKNEKVDLILLDIMMPKMSGWDVCFALKNSQKTKDIPIIMLTVRRLSDEGLVKAKSYKFKKLDIADYIEKPFKADDLVKRIKKVLKKVGE